MPLSKGDCIEILKTDFAGLHTQHAGAWTGFNVTLQIIIVIETLPWIAASSILHQGAGFFDLIQSLPFILTLGIGAILGTIGYKILVFNRKLINLYARWLNYYRQILAINGVPVGALSKGVSATRNPNFAHLPAGPMFVDPSKPNDRDDRDHENIMFVLHGAFTWINGIYGASAVAAIWLLTWRRVYNAPGLLHAASWAWLVAVLLWATALTSIWQYYDRWLNKEIGA